MERGVVEEKGIERKADRQSHRCRQTETGDYDNNNNDDDDDDDDAIVVTKKKETRKGQQHR